MKLSKHYYLTYGGSCRKMYYGEHPTVKNAKRCTQPGPHPHFMLVDPGKRKIRRKTKCG